MSGLTVTCRVVVVSQGISQLHGQELPWLSSTSVIQNASLEAESLDLTSIPEVKN